MWGEKPQSVDFELEDLNGNRSPIIRTDSLLFAVFLQKADALLWAIHQQYGDKGVKYWLSALQVELQGSDRARNQVKSFDGVTLPIGPCSEVRI